MKHLRDYILIISFFFLGVFAYESCHKANKSEDIDLSKYVKVKEVHDTVYTKTYRNRYIKGDSIPFVIIATDTTTIHDTIRIINDYNAVLAYTDTINQDSNIFVINDTISQNRIKSRSFEAKITEKTIYVKQFYAEKAKYRLYYGIRGDFSQSNGLEVVSPGLMLNAKNKALIGLNLNINKNNNMSYSGSLYFKIGKK
jgi:hypothetical protein